MTVSLSLLSLPDVDSVLKMNQNSCGWLMFSKSKFYRFCNIIFISVGCHVDPGRVQRLAKRIVAE
ncbi:hypothetical protein D1BOALGB6SA_8441 [Olavius sp. associated proteobacterium Delta 1]|nr:hypothetical protein D1BOALGB6SA_8441 [Olavius sp. associated proteobacterium Delta 1]